MSVQYFIVKDDKREGPFSYEKLRSLGLKKDSLIWREGLDDWVSLNQLEELKDLIKATPPPIPKTGKAEVVIKTETPIAFEDNIKKQKLQTRKQKNAKAKRTTANEIKRSSKYLRYAIITLAVSFPIVFVIYGGLKFLPYYFSSDYGSEVSRKISDIKSESLYKLNDSDGYAEWAERTDMDISISTIFLIAKIHDFSQSDYEKGYIYWDKSNNKGVRISLMYDYDQVLVASGNSYYEDLNGNVIEPRNTVGTDILESLNSNRDFRVDMEKQVVAGTVKKKWEIANAEILIRYGRIVQRNVEYAFEYALYWSIGLFLIVFPGLFLMSLAMKGIRSSKEWVDNNSD